MSKPTMPGELRDVKIEAISLVTRAANRKTFKIFKSADKDIEPSESEGKQKDASTSITEEESRLFHVLKSFFMSEHVLKGEMEDKFRAADKKDKLYKAVEAFQQALGYSWDSKGPETDVKKIKSALSDFQKICGEILLSTDADIKKFAKEVQKSGRKISASRLTELKAAYATLARIIEETDGEPDTGGDATVVKEELEKLVKETDGELDTGGDATVVKEELEKLVKESVGEAIKPVTGRLEVLEKSEKDAADKNDGAGVEKNEQDVFEVVKTAVAEAMTPIGERLEKLEKARGFSNKIPEESEVQKKRSLFAGAFTAN